MYVIAFYRDFEIFYDIEDSQLVLLGIDNDGLKVSGHISLPDLPNGCDPNSFVQAAEKWIDCFYIEKNTFF
jgi:hypothetical protein